MNVFMVLGALWEGTLQVSGIKAVEGGLQQKKYWLVAFIPAICLFLKYSSEIEVEGSSAKHCTQTAACVYGRRL